MERYLLVNNIEYAIDPADTAVDRADYALESDYLAACADAIAEIEEHLPTSNIVVILDLDDDEFADEVGTADAAIDAVSDTVGWLIQSADVQRTVTGDDPLMPLTDAAYSALNAVTSQTKTDCWFWLEVLLERADADITYYHVRDLEEDEEMAWPDALSQLGEALDGQELKITEEERDALEELYRFFNVPMPQILMMGGV